jgi:hypothetical protein
VYQSAGLVPIRMLLTSGALLGAETPSGVRKNSSTMMK